MKRTGLLLGLLATAMLGWPSSPAPAQVLHLPLCHGGAVDIPVGPKTPTHDKSCPGACHAPLCQGRKRLGATSV